MSTTIHTVNIVITVCVMEIIRAFMSKYEHNILITFFNDLPVT